MPDVACTGYFDRISVFPAANRNRSWDTLDIRGTTGSFAFPHPLEGRPRIRNAALAAFLILTAPRTKLRVKPSGHNSPVGALIAERVELAVDVFRFIDDLLVRVHNAGVAGDAVFTLRVRGLRKR